MLLLYAVVRIQTPIKKEYRILYFIPSAFAAITIQHKGGGLKITKQAQ
jgi:hypothetical protein